MGTWTSRRQVCFLLLPALLSVLMCIEFDKAAPKGRKTMPKLPWELLTPFSDFVRGLPLPSKNRVGVVEDEDEEDEDEMQAYQDSMQRLRVSSPPSFSWISSNLLSGGDRTRTRSRRR